MTATGGTTFATAQGVVDRVHRDAADVRADAQPARTARLAQVLLVVVGVAGLAHRRAAILGDLAQLARGQAKQGMLALLGHQLRRGTGRAAHLRALARLQLDRVHHRTDRDGTQRQRVARLDVGVLARDDDVADLEVQRRDDVPLLAVRVVQQRDASRAIRIVLDGRHRRRHRHLVALEVDQAVVALVTAAALVRGDAAVAVATRGLVLVDQQRLVRLVGRDVREVVECELARACRHRPVMLDAHGLSPDLTKGSIWLRTI
jgi:hypothetical protein